MLRFLTTFGMCAFALTPAVAEPIDGKAARKMLFSPNGAEVTLRDESGLSETNRALLKSVLEAEAASKGYYGVAVISPDEDLLKSEATVALANYHSVEEAAEAALSICNEKRSGEAECVVAAEIRPKKWEAREISLSREATEAFRSDYRKGQGPKALAISRATGQWAIFKGENAVFAAKIQCNEKAGAQGKADCETVIAD